jgi:hypothetical protein
MNPYQLSLAQALGQSVVHGITLGLIPIAAILNSAPASACDRSQMFLQALGRSGTEKRKRDMLRCRKPPSEKARK